LKVDAARIVVDVRADLVAPRQRMHDDRVLQGLRGERALAELKVVAAPCSLRMALRSAGRVM
jgi:hypothetical protein